MNAYRTGTTSLALLTALAAGGASATTLVPAPVIEDMLFVQLEDMGRVVPAARSNNIAAPVAINDHLYVVDQRNSIISIRDNDGTMRQIIDASGVPAGVTQANFENVLGIAGQGDSAYVAYYSASLPDGFSSSEPMPTDPEYVVREPRFELIYQYDVAADGSLSNPQPISAFDASINGHRSGGMIVLPDGQLLFARGDNLSPGFAGLTAPQDLGTSVSKLLLIDPETGDTQIVAQGLRNVQRLTFTDDSQSRIAFSDIGWSVAEEINVVAVADLLDTTTIENFGWGTAADGLIREGTLYVENDTGENGIATGMTPLGEPGFEQPFAQFGRGDLEGFFAVSGPVASEVSFDSIGLLFGDIVNGGLYATLAGATGTVNDVYSVGLIGPDGRATTFAELFGPDRDDLRLFNFTDNSAGLLLEKSGRIFRLSQATLAAVPLTASGWYLAAMLAVTAAWARRRQTL